MQTAERLIIYFQFKIFFLREKILKKKNGSLWRAVTYYNFINFLIGANGKPGSPRNEHSNKIKKRKTKQYMKIEIKKRTGVKGFSQIKTLHLPSVPRFLSHTRLYPEKRERNKCPKLIFSCYNEPRIHFLLLLF